MKLLLFLLVALFADVSAILINIAGPGDEALAMLSGGFMAASGMCVVALFSQSHNSP